MNEIKKIMDGIGRITVTIIMFIVLVMVYEYYSEFVAGILTIPFFIFIFSILDD